MPYDEELLQSLDDAINLALGEFIIVGDKNLIIEKCFKLKISSQQFIIYNIIEELYVIDFCRNVIDESKIDMVIFGNISNKYQNKILGEDDKKEIGIIDVIDLPFLRHFLFVSNYSKHLNIDFDDKKKAIILADNFMKLLDIKQTNVALISNLNTKTDVLEANIIKMILRDNNYNNVNIFESFNINALFNKNHSVNIFNSNINLLIFRNYESSEIFINTLYVVTQVKYAKILVATKCYAFDSYTLNNNQNILFTIMLIGKVVKKSKVKEQREKQII